MEKKKLFLVSLGHLSCDVNGGAIPAALPYLRAAHNLDYQATGGLMLAYSCLSSIIQPLLGLLADRHNKPWFIPLGVVLAGCGLAVMGWMSSYWLIFAGIAISGIGSAFFHPEGARYANRVSGSHKGTGLSIFSIGGNSGFILGPILVTAFVGAFGLPGMTVFAILALVMAIVLILGISRLPASISRPADAKAGLKSARLDAGDPAAAEGAELAAAGETMPAKNNWREFSRLIVVILSRAVVFNGCNTFIPLYWVGALGQSKGAGALALVIFGACGVACNLLGGFLADRFGYVPVIRAAFIIMCPTALAFGLAGDIWGSYLLLPLLGLSLYLPFSAQVALGQKLLARNIGFASGVTLGLATTIGGLAQPFLGWLADRQGLSSVFICLACVALAGAVFTFLLANTKAASNGAD